MLRSKPGANESGERSSWCEARGWVSLAGAVAGMSCKLANSVHAVNWNEEWSGRDDLPT